MKKLSSNVEWSKYIDQLGSVINDSNAELYANLFYNVFAPIENAVQLHLYENGSIPLAELQDEMNGFTEFFPKENRCELLKDRYFDDRIDSCIKHFSQIQRSEIKMKILSLDFEIKKNSEVFREHLIATKSDEERNPLLKEGTEFSRYREIKDYDDAKTRFEKTIGLSGFQSELKRFDKLFGDGFEKAFSDELNAINEFIDKAELLNVNDAFSDKRQDNEQHQYLRLKYDYYRNHNYISKYTYYNPSEIFAPLDASIYGRYFLFREWLILKLNSLPDKQLDKTKKVKALFDFIQYLHSNIDNFNKNNELIDELLEIRQQKIELNPQKNYLEKQKFDELQTILESKFKVLQNNTAVLIKAKAEELNVCKFDDEPDYDFNGVQEEITQLKENFKTTDLAEIFVHKAKYIEYRSRTHKTFLSLQFFFDELDEILKSLFDFFRETEENEFEAFETKAKRINNLSEAVELMKSETSGLRIPNGVRINSHEVLYRAVIFSANEEPNKPIEGAFELLKEVWLFLNSDRATFNGKEIEKNKRPLLVNPVIIGKPEFDKFFEAEITYCSTQNKIGLKEQDFIASLSEWIAKAIKDESLTITQKRKFTEFLEFIKAKDLPFQQSKQQKPELIKARILFSSPQIIIKLHQELKGYFIGKENELLFIFKGEYENEEKLFFPDRGNKFVEVFRRLQYNHLISNNYAEIRDWICAHFCFKDNKGGKEKAKPFNSTSVYDILRGKDGTIPPKRSRILVDIEWLPFKSREQLQREDEKN